MSIVVFGSINMDLVVRSPRLPVPGETVVGSTFFTAPGGKGANQAVAAARLGATPLMIGRVGDDLFGETLRQGLRDNGVDVQHVATAPGASGTALITVSERGENTIVVVPGANFGFVEADLPTLSTVIRNAELLLLQMEIPLNITQAAALAAQSHSSDQRRVKVILDPAPVRPIPDALYKAVDVITPNETEAAALVGFPIHTLDDAARAAQFFLDRGVQHAVIKMGGKGAFWLAAGGVGKRIPAFTVNAIDTVAAGDAFNGGLAFALSEGKPFEEALRWASATGAMSTTKQGAQPSLPYRHEVEALLDA